METSEARAGATGRVREALSALGLDCRVVEYAESTRTAAEAAASIGCQPGQIVKSLVFKGLASGQPLLVLASGPSRVDEKLLAALAGEPVGRATAEFVRESTGFAIGGVPPVGHARPMRAWVDGALLQYPEVWAAAGTPHAVFALPSSELARACGGIVARLS